MPEYIVVFIAKGTKVTWWSEADDLFTAQLYCEEIPYHTPELGAGHILTECPEHGWRPTEDGICQNCIEAYWEFEWRQDPSYDPVALDEYDYSEEEL